jgi:multiple sugar transport system substrate-binding protein
VVVTAAILAGCGAGDQAEDDRRPKVVKLWTHVAGNPEELSLIEKIITDFNASQGEYRVVHEPFPQGDYNEVVVGAVGARNLPCLLDVDGPTMPSWAWANYLTPLDLPRETVDEFLPSTVGRFRDRIYSIGIYDAAMAMFARRSVLLRHNIRVPTMDRPWTQAEFDAALVKLKAAGFEYPLNLGTGYDPGEWWSYAYSPMLQSFGGDLIDRSSYRSAGGALNGSAAVAFGQWWQSLFTRGLADPREDTDRMDFIRGKTALIWDGNWNAKEVLRVFEDAVFLPPPDLGRGPKIGSASWQWAISASCDHRAGAMAYLRFSLNAKYIAAFAEGVGLIPATEQAAAMTTNYKQGGAMRIFAEYARKYGELRPPTAAYPKVSSAFTDALRDITDGVAVKERLDEAVAEIDRKLRSSDNYA